MLDIDETRNSWKAVHSSILRWACLFWVFVENMNVLTVSYKGVNIILNAVLWHIALGQPYHCYQYSALDFQLLHLWNLDQDGWHDIFLPYVVSSNVFLIHIWYQLMSTWWFKYIETWCVFSTWLEPCPMRIYIIGTTHDIDELMQEKHSSIANVLEFCLSCINPPISTDQHTSAS